MADNTQLNANTTAGDTIATDDIGGIKHQRVKVQYGVDGSATDVSASNPMPVDVSSLPVIKAVDSNNSTTTPLTGSATFTGTATNILGYSTATVLIFADQDSATNGLSFETSVDGTNWDHAHTYTLSANAGRCIEYGLSGTYFRIVYTNGSNAQSAFRLQTVLNRQWEGAHQHPIAYSLDGQHPAAITRSIVTAEKPDTTYTNIGATTGGNLKISVEEISNGLDVGAGNAGTETQRVSISTDDVNLSSINTDMGTLAGAVSGTAFNITNADTVSTNNSTTTPLGISGTFVGTGDDALGYSSVSIVLYADQASATDGMTFQFSTDNSNWDDTYTFTLAAGSTRRFEFPVTARYFRVNYTNGTSAQSAFRVQTLLHQQPINTTIHRIEDNVSTDRSATLVKSAIIAQVNGSGDFVPIQSTASGILKIGGGVDVDVLPGTAAEAAALPSVFMVVAGDDGTDTHPLQTDTNGALKAILQANSGVDIGDVDITSIAAGTNVIGDVGISGARTSGGTTLHRNVDVDETEDAVKASAGQLYWLHAMNLTASPLYLQFYNATVASVTVGTTTPNLTFPLPTQGDTNGAGFTLAIPNGIAFSTAITIACTTTIGGASGPATNGCIVNLGYA